MTDVAGRLHDDAATVDGQRPRLTDFWHPIAAADEVTGQPGRFTLLGEQLAVFRDHHGVHAFSDVCIHRGAALSLGCVENGRIICAYHGWQYDYDGRCVKIPSLAEGLAVPRKARAITYPAVESAGLVWVCLGEAAARIPSCPGGAWSDPSFHTFLLHRGYWTASASRVVENFMDFSHFPFVHAGLLGDPSAAVISAEVTGPIESDDHGFSYWFDCDEPAESAYPGRKRFLYTLETPFAIHLRRPIGDGAVAMVSLIASPVSEAETDIFVISSRNGDLDTPDSVYSDFADEIMRQDQPVVQSQRPDRIPVDLRKEMHIKVPDAHAVAYRRALSGIDGTFGFMP